MGSKYQQEDSVGIARCDTCGHYVEVFEGINGPAWQIHCPDTGIRRGVGEISSRRPCRRSGDYVRGIEVFLGSAEEIRSRALESMTETELLLEEISGHAPLG